MGSPRTGYALNRGFTLVELVAVIVILAALAAFALARYIDLTDEARQAAVDEQAANLVTRNALNVAACATDSPECIPFATTGYTSPGACQDAVAQLLPGAQDNFEATTYGSATPRDEWRDLPGDGEALFWATRTVEVPFRQTVPCVLSRKN